MAQQLTAADAKQSLCAHVAAKGIDVCCKYGPRIGWIELERVLQDRTAVRYPCEVVFDAAPLQPGECAHVIQRGKSPEDGFTIYVNPWFARDRDRAVYLVLYQLIVVNYGDFASAYEAETFGAAALGLTCDEYYDILCDLADELGASAESEPIGCHPRIDDANA